MGRLLSTAARLIEHEWNAALAGLDLTHAGLLTLHALVEGPHTQRQLAGLSHVEEQTMSRVLDRLERSGYVTRERDTRDRRRLLVELTPYGEAAYRNAVDSGTADALVSDRVADPERFRADLVELVRRLLAAQAGEDETSGQDAD
jgi:DNA-binding MarR family transcriptional regulator